MHRVTFGPKPALYHGGSCFLFLVVRGSKLGNITIRVRFIMNCDEVAVSLSTQSAYIFRKRYAFYPKTSSVLSKFMFDEVKLIVIILCSRHIFPSMPRMAYHMMTSTNVNIFRVNGHFCRELTGLR